MGMKRLLPLLAVLVLLAAVAGWWISTRVKMTVEHPETPQAEIATPELPKEDPAIVLAVRNSIPSAETEAGLAEMLKNGADPNAVDLKGRPVLYWAIANGHLKTAEALIAGGADVNKVDADSHWTLLMHAVYQAARDASRTKMVGLLIEKGADVNLNPQGYTPLHVAVNNGEEKTSAQVLDLLLRNGANPNLEMPPGAADAVPLASPLHDAAREGKIRLAKLLVKGGARTDLKGPGGKTPSEIAQEHGHKELSQALRVAAVVEKPKGQKKKGKSN
jgi:ankyrin repeat protein